MESVSQRAAFALPSLHRLALCPSIDQVYPGGIVPARQANLPGDWERCAICLVPLSEPAGDNPVRTNHVAVLEMSCRHAFHAACLGAWLRNHTDCPMCRIAVDPVEFEELVAYHSGAPLLTSEQIDNFLNAFMPTADYDVVTAKIVIGELERSLGLGENALRAQRPMIRWRLDVYLAKEARWRV